MTLEQAFLKLYRKSLEDVDSLQKRYSIGISSISKDYKNYGISISIDGDYITFSYYGDEYGIQFNEYSDENNNFTRVYLNGEELKDDSFKDFLFKNGIYRC